MKDQQSESKQQKQNQKPHLQFRGEEVGQGGGSVKTSVCHHQFLPGLRTAADTDTKLKPLPPLTPPLTRSDHDCLLFCRTSQMPTF